MFRGALLALATLFAAPATHADRLITRDGRLLTVKKARKLPDGGYRLEFEHGTLDCAQEFVASVEIEGDMSDYVPANEDEQKKLAQGYVRYQGRWMSRPAYESELNRLTQERRQRVAYLAEHSEFHNAWEKETRHFRIRTNTSPELLEYYCDLLESYYDIMDKRVGINPTPTLRRTKMTVNIYKSRDEFHRLNSAGLGGGVAGYFSFLEESLNFYHDFQEPTLSDWVALHECTHLLTYLIEPQSWPRIWINEGVADFFGSADIELDKRGKLVIHPGKLQVDRVLTVQQAIKDGDFVPLETLFRVEKSDFTAFEYAHSWSFVYFLNNSSSKYKSGFEKFFKTYYTLEKGVEYDYEPFPNQQGTAKMCSAEEVRRILLDKLKVRDVAALEKEWLDFIAAIEIDAPDALFKRGYRTMLRFDSENFDQAKKDIDAAIEAGVRDPRAFWARGLLRIFGERVDFPGAIADFRKALEQAPLEADFHYNLAQTMAGPMMIAQMGNVNIDWGDAAQELSGTPEELEEAREHFGLAMDLAPDNDFYRSAYDEYVQALAKHAGGGSGSGAADEGQ
jgi:tetratricopeptide (TPR) repeat protein